MRDLINGFVQTSSSSQAIFFLHILEENAYVTIVRSSSMTLFEEMLKPYLKTCKHKHSHGKNQVYPLLVVCKKKGAANLK